MSTPDEPTPNPAAPPAADPPPNPAGDPPQPPGTPAGPSGDLPEDKPLGPAGEKALAEWKARARAAEKERAEHAARLKEFEDREKTEAQRLTEAAQAAEERAARATRAAVAAKVEALAAGTFADPEDAVGALDPAKYVDDSGVIDADAIRADLAALLERKPHWARGTGPRTPRPDPSQGPRPNGTPGGVDEQIAAAQAKGDWRTVLRLQNSKLADAGKTTT
ncbi:hypothetical protein [Streptomyces sp. CC228A]|uniref:hypothetical protein n=1 Tax=Streptomyces sp. CC228A TaxID=2898186 RepID=UPI001F26A8C9|nr:hypothetical protein [Streptomyces sp. CC228A]